MRYKSSFIPLLRVQNIEVDLHKGFAHSVNLIRLYGALRLRQRLLTLTEINTALRLSRWYATKISVYQILGVMILSNSDHRLLRWFVLFGEIFAKIVARHLEVFLHRSVALTGAARLFPYVLRQTPNSRLGPAEKYHFSLSKSKKRKIDRFISNIFSHILVLPVFFVHHRVQFVSVLLDGQLHVVPQRWNHARASLGLVSLAVKTVQTEGKK